MFVTGCWQRNSDAYSYIDNYIAASVVTPGQVYCSGCDLKSTVMFCDCMMMNVIIIYIYNVPINTECWKYVLCKHYSTLTGTFLWLWFYRYMVMFVTVYWWLHTFLCIDKYWQVHCCVCDCMLMSTYLSCVWLHWQVRCCICDCMLMNKYLSCVWLHWVDRYMVMFITACWWVHTCHVNDCIDKYIVVFVTVCCHVHLVMTVNLAGI